MAEGYEPNLRPIMFDSGAVTTDNEGFVSITFSGDAKHIIISAWTISSDVIPLFYPTSNSDISGKHQWWFKMINANNLSAKTNFSTTLYYAYI